MKNKIIILLACILLCILSIGLFLILNHNNEMEPIAKYNNDSMEESKIEPAYSVSYNYEEYKDIPINYICPSYAYDTSTPEQAIGIADYTFIGKVNKILRTEYRHPTQSVIDGEIKTVASPYTVYEVNVIRNINGNLVTNESIEIAQNGGLEQDKLSYSFFEGMGLLNVGEYYILLGFAQPDGSILFDNPNFAISLGNLDEDLTQTISTKSTSEILSTTTINSSYKPDSTPADVINKYIKAAQEPIIPEDRQKEKSILYDVEYKN